MRPKTVPDFGIGGAGQQGDDANSFGAQFFPQGIREAERSVFGGNVGSRSGEDAIGYDGKTIHDGGAALHHGERGLRYQERAG